MMSSIRRLKAYVAGVVAAAWSLLLPAVGFAVTGEECNEKFTVGSDQWRQCISDAANQGIESPIDTGIWVIPIVITVAIMLLYAVFYTRVVKKARQTWKEQSQAQSKKYEYDLESGQLKKVVTLKESATDQTVNIGDMKGSVEIEVDEYGRQSTGTDRKGGRRIPFVTAMILLVSLTPLAVGVALLLDGNNVGVYVIPGSILLYLLLSGIRSIASGRLAKRRGSEEYSYIDQQHSR